MLLQMRYTIDLSRDFAIVVYENQSNDQISGFLIRCLCFQIQIGYHWSMHQDYDHSSFLTVRLISLKNESLFSRCERICRNSDF